jgi:hypothetical protein
MVVVDTLNCKVAIRVRLSTVYAKRDAAITAARNFTNLVADIALNCEMAAAATVREIRRVY